MSPLPDLAHFATIPVTTPTPDASRQAQIEAVLLQLPGVSTKEIGGLHAYMVNDMMFACISGEGIGIRVPTATANELLFSRGDVFAFTPRGMASSREWVQINRADATEYAQDLELFRTSMAYVKGSRPR